MEDLRHPYTFQVVAVFWHSPLFDSRCRMQAFLRPTSIWERVSLRAFEKPYPLSRPFRSHYPHSTKTLNLKILHTLLQQRVVLCPCQGSREFRQCVRIQYRCCLYEKKVFSYCGYVVVWRSVHSPMLHL